MAVERVRSDSAVRDVGAEVMVAWLRGRHFELGNLIRATGIPPVGDVAGIGPFLAVNTETVLVIAGIERPSVSQRWISESRLSSVNLTNRVCNEASTVMITPRRLAPAGVLVDRFAIPTAERTNHILQFVSLPCTRNAQPTIFLITHGLLIDGVQLIQKPCVFFLVRMLQRELDRLANQMRPAELVLRE